MIYIYKPSIWVLISFMIFMANRLSAQNEEISIESIVVDDQGNHIAGAEIYSGRSYTKTDATGKFKIEAEPGSSLVVEASGFESMTVSIEEAKSSTNLRLVTNPHLKGSNDP